MKYNISKHFGKICTPISEGMIKYNVDSTPETLFSNVTIATGGWSKFKLAVTLFP